MSDAAQLLGDLPPWERSEAWRWYDYLDEGAVAEDDGGVEGAVDAGGGDGEDPGGGVDDGVGVGAVVAAGADDEDAPLVGVEGAERDGVGEEVGLEGGAHADGDGHHVHAVAHSVVDGLEHGRARAPAQRARLVHGHAARRRAALRRAAGQAVVPRAGHHRARRRRRRVRAVPHGVPRRAACRRHRPRRRRRRRRAGLAAVVPRADELLVAAALLEVRAFHAHAAPPRRHRPHPGVAEARRLRPHTCRRPQ
ncbi:Os01g0278975 [Oryza sativa Japonica Group]|uniref:Os01g0278975 protein n=1 Tax=Oryza sativa subsp. japonica TaxID=39947 RepID=A0A0P0V150_ORYSJ|nr:hypothetical protein EE612_001808 [Oryza sativa]BAS71575.1 Os01g0278975 [Oryza sativa Japonica Group]